jgi:hypothetical protein
MATLRYAAELPSDITMLADLRRELIAVQSDLADARTALVAEETGAEPATVSFWRGRAQEATRLLRLEREQRISLETRSASSPSGSDRSQRR